jgi:hypothetical protein
MSRSRKTNRDHAKKKQRPMIEDEVIATQLEQLLTPAITAQENYYRQLKLRDCPKGSDASRQSNPQFTIDGGDGTNSSVARCSRSEGTN